MFLKKKEKKYQIPKEAYSFPPKHRFSFVALGWSYEMAFTVNISEKIKNIRKAFFIACEVFKEKFPDKVSGSVAVFYGDVEAPECNDILLGAYNCFAKKKRKKN